MINDQRSVYIMADWICEYCGRENHDIQCFYCGAPKPIRKASKAELEWVNSVSKEIREEFLKILSLMC